jgi:hypothetical protein
MNIRPRDKNGNLEIRERGGDKRRNLFPVYLSFMCNYLEYILYHFLYKHR